MTDKQTEILLSVGVSEDQFQYYYFSDKEEIFTPIYDMENKMIKTGKEVYDEYINPPTPELSDDEILRAKLIKDNADMQLQLTQQQKFNSDLLLKIASLGGSTNV